MKARNLSAMAILAVTTQSIPGSHANENCRSTTSTQALSCQGIRCKPDYTGGCNTDVEYTKSSTQRSCTEPGVEEVGTAAICYYDDVCCAIDLWDGEVGRINDNNDGGSNNEWGGASTTTLRENEENNNNLSDQQNASDSASDNNNAAGVGVAFAFVSIAIAALYFAFVSKRKSNENSTADGNSSNVEQGSRAIVKHTKEKSRAKRTIYDDVHSHSMTQESDGGTSARSSKKKKKKKGTRPINDHDDYFSRGSDEIEIPTSIQNVMQERDRDTSSARSSKKKKNRRPTIHDDDDSFGV